MPKIEYGYEPRQVIFYPPEDYTGRWALGCGRPVLLRWNGGGYSQIERLDPSVPTQVGNMDWGFAPASASGRPVAGLDLQRRIAYKVPHLPETGQCC